MVGLLENSLLLPEFLAEPLGALAGPVELLDCLALENVRRFGSHRCLRGKVGENPGRFRRPWARSPPVVLGLEDLGAACALAAVLPPVGRAREEGPPPLACPLPLPASLGRPGPLARLLRRPRRDVIGHRAFLVAPLKSLPSLPCPWDMRCSNQNCS